MPRRHFLPRILEQRNAGEIRKIKAPGFDVKKGFWNRNTAAFRLAWISLLNSQLGRWLFFPGLAVDHGPAVRMEDLSGHV